MNPNQRLIYAELAEEHPAGLTRDEIGQRTGLSTDDLIRALAGEGAHFRKATDHGYTKWFLREAPEQITRACCAAVEARETEASVFTRHESSTPDTPHRTRDTHPADTEPTPAPATTDRAALLRYLRMRRGSSR